MSGGHAPSVLSRLGVLVALSAGAASASTLFTDATFSLANYTETSYTLNTGSGGANATNTLTQDGTIGNAVPSLKLDITWTNNTTFTIFDGLINNGFTYNPSVSGAIGSIDFSLDRYTTFTAGTVVLGNAGASILLQQNGNFYLDSITGPSFVSATWQTVSTTGLHASAFCLFSFTTDTTDCGQNPDFSSTGSAIGLGIRLGLGHSNPLGTGSFDTYADNLSITVNTVPEPSSAPLLLSGIAGIAAACAFRRRRAAGDA